MKLKLLILVLSLQTAWALYTVVQQERVLSYGSAIMLETQRIDPRDLLRGDYLILNYKISDIPTNLFSPPLPRNPAAGTAVYVVLTQHGKFYEPLRASTQSLAPAAGEVLLLGNSGLARWNSPSSVHVEYGLERYYVHEGAGNIGGSITVEVAASGDGHATIKQVFVNGKPYAEAIKPAR